MNRRFILTLIVPIVLGCSDGESPTEPIGEFFTFEVTGERFRVLITDPEAIRLARENYEGRNSKFPAGSIQRGDAGYNQPWNWSYIPNTVRMVDMAIEACDGRPSYVNSHVNDYLQLGYCPWGARVVRLGR